MGEIINMDAIESILKKIPFFQDIDYPLKDLVKKMRLERFEENTIIFSEGEKGSSLYLIISGKVLIYSKSSMGQEMAIQTLEPSEFFGEMSLLDGGYRSASARTLEKSITLSLERKDFLEFLHNNPKTAIKIIEILSKRIRQSNVRNKILIETNRRLSNMGPNKNQLAAGNVTINGQPGKLELDTDDYTLTKKEEERQLHKTGSSNFADTLEQHLSEIESTSGDNEKTSEKKEVELKDMLYYKKAACPICEANFQSPKVLSKYIQTLKIDNDFCQHYNLVNPLFYEINVCPVCGFAYNEEILSMRLRKEQSEAIKARLMAFWQENTLKDYSSVRTLEDAIETFLLAIFSLKSQHFKRSQLGMLYLKIAWLYRFKNETAQEQKYIEKALVNLAHAFEQENFSSIKSEINTAYLLGVLNLNIGNNLEAARWLDRVLRHPAKSMFPAIISQTRELWTDVRQKLRKEKEQAKQESTNTMN